MRTALTIDDEATLLNEEIAERALVELWITCDDVTERVTTILEVPLIELVVVDALLDTLMLEVLDNTDTLDDLDLDVEGLALVLGSAVLNAETRHEAS